MRAFFALYREGLLWLIRDKIFGPVVIGGIVVAAFANMASNWSLENYIKMLFDTGILGFRIVGGIVAIMWGSRMIHDAMHERSLDPRLAAPIGRHVWYLARYAALASVLLMMGVAFAITWQLTMLYGSYGYMNNAQSWALGLLVLEWFVLATLSMTLATFSGFGLSLFLSLLLWIVGLSTPMLAAVKDPRVSELQKLIISTVADVWNFQRFNLLDQLAVGQHTVELTDIKMRLAWIISTGVAILIAGTWRFSERDLG